MTETLNDKFCCVLAVYINLSSINYSRNPVYNFFPQTNAVGPEEGSAGDEYVISVAVRTLDPSPKTEFWYTLVE